MKRDRQPDKVKIRVEHTPGEWVDITLERGKRLTCIRPIDIEALGLRLEGEATIVIELA